MGQMGHRSQNITHSQLSS